MQILIYFIFDRQELQSNIEETLEEVTKQCILSIENGVTDMKDVFSDMQTKIAYNKQKQEAEEEEEVHKKEQKKQQVIK